MDLQPTVDLDQADHNFPVCRPGGSLNSALKRLSFRPEGGTTYQPGATPRERKRSLKSPSSLLPVCPRSRRNSGENAGLRNDQRDADALAAVGASWGTQCGNRSQTIPQPPRDPSFATRPSKRGQRPLERLSAKARLGASGGPGLVPSGVVSRRRADITHPLVGQAHDQVLENGWRP